MEFAKVHVFSYSPRKGTSATFFRERIHPSAVRERARRLRAVAAETAALFRQRFLGTRQEVLIEEEGVGSTSQFIKVKLEGGLPVGRLAPVRISGVTPDGLTGSPA